jgi:hypothetical protein
VLATEGLPDAGGVDVDAAVVSHIGASHAARDPEAWHRLTNPSTPAALALLTFYGLSNAVVFAHGVAPISTDAIVARVAELVILGGCGGLLAAGVLAMVRIAHAPAPQPANPGTGKDYR